MRHLKKDTGGYALLYVLVIVMVLVAISMMICTVALRNLQSQQAAVERMADKYAAQGEIEKIKAIAEDKSALGVDGSYDEPAKEYLDALKSKVDEKVDFSGPESVAATEEEIVVSIECTADNVKVSAELKIDIDYTPTEVETGMVDESGNPKKKTVYSIKSISTSFTSYAIENTGGDAG